MENPKNSTPSRNSSEKTPNRKLNSVLFVLGATVMNILVMIGAFAILFMLHIRFLAPLVSQDLSLWITVGILIVSILMSYFLYHLFIKWFSRRVDMEKYFDPLFRVGGRKK